MVILEHKAFKAYDIHGRVPDGNAALVDARVDEIRALMASAG